MEQLHTWQQKLEAGLEALRQQQADLAVRINRQEGALLFLLEMIKVSGEAEQKQPAEVVAEAEPVV